MLGNARYAHKSARSGLCSVCVYTQALSQGEQRRSEIIHSFQSALEREEFEVYVQPQVRCSDKQVCGAEALVRWRRPDRGLCYPDEFIPVLEQTGDIVDLDFFVYRKVFEFQHGARMRGRQPIPISVNVSRVHLLNSEEFLARLRLLHEEFPIPASLVMFELTESAYIQEINHAKQLIAKLHHLGYRVSMDDFGSGYSSLKVLQTTPFDEIKFDKAFLRKSPEEKEDCLFLHIIELVKRLGAPVVCEGAETQAHVELLERSACDIIQGYYYYRPFPLGELHEESASPVPPVRASLPRLCS
ncbi:putative signaling protein [bioreactor metagenome]|uniref:Putative signaling protein n=1 Tax=bioreactor metagenome TaxID=1076179 RepID=A0A645D7C7_9ZZZZ